MCFQLLSYYIRRLFLSAFSELLDNVNIDNYGSIAIPGLFAGDPKDVIDPTVGKWVTALKLHVTQLS